MQKHRNLAVTLGRSSRSSMPQISFVLIETLCAGAATGKATLSVLAGETRTRNQMGFAASDPRCSGSAHLGKTMQVNPVHYHLTRHPMHGEAA